MVALARGYALVYRSRYPMRQETAMAYVVQRRDRWYTVAYEGIDPITGRSHRQWHPALDEAAARHAAVELSSEPPRGASSRFGITLARYLTGRWLPARRSALRPTTRFRYEKMIEQYVVPRVGRVPLRSLTVRHLERLYAELLAAGRRDGTGLAPKTVLNVHQVLRKALSDAVRRGLVARNVALAVDPPTAHVGAEQRCWTAAELRRFLAVAADHRLFPALWLAATTG